MPTHGFNIEHTYTSLPQIFYQYHNPTLAKTPQTVIFNCELAQNLGLNPSSPWDKILSGTKLPPKAKPICQAYAGYQFGHFAMLGDGRAVLLGEQITPSGNRYDIQLKGAGPTPLSRGGDGYAALLPMLREYIVSEAMFHLGIPTTRSLAVVLTGKPVMREKILPGAVLTRVATSHIRVGTFNYSSAFGTVEDTRALADYCIWRHFPWILPSGKPLSRYVLFFREVATRQAELIAKWQLVGFIHGVMNTDNMSICGETIDYGPCAFMDTYDPDTVFSSIDAAGRYAYKNQPVIGAWNLSRFAEALLPMFHENETKAIELAQGEIERYQQAYEKHWLAGMRAKLGLEGEKPEDAGIAEELLDLMYKHKLDFTNTFRALSHTGISRAGSEAGVAIPALNGSTQAKKSKHFKAFPPSRQQAASGADINVNGHKLPETPDFTAWHKKWRKRQGNQECASQIMNKHNPAVIPRNYRVEEALAAAGQGDYSVMHNLLAALRKPFEECDMYTLPPVQGSCGYKTFCGT